ncbi:hypothetical protein HNQ77_001477 [Silvibacterium bohemicum]|uniref:Uncharacterized protein n=1 Tax=Silvibacterium bohemicum TaxID=1577686 RepID=A0A841JYL7_9BACT|nr:hypothetical protein [Silvibacterium bohemicum]
MNNDKKTGRTTPPPETEGGKRIEDYEVPAGRKLKPEKRFVAAKSTKLMLKQFLTNKLIYFINL